MRTIILASTNEWWIKDVYDDDSEQEAVFLDDYLALKAQTDKLEEKLTIAVEALEERYRQVYGNALFEQIEIPCKVAMALKQIKETK